MFDNGVSNALRGELNSQMVESSSRYGDLFEAFVIQECFRVNDYNHLDLKFSHWRTNNDIEVDLVISRGAGRPIAAIEINSLKHPEHKHFGSLQRFSRDYPKALLFCVSAAPQPYNVEGIAVVPYREIPKILSELK
jgi:predicted AAA+ superfamily ATPase